VLNPIENFEQYLTDKLTYWRNHKTSLDCREKYTEHYFEKESLFKNSIISFLNHSEMNEFYAIKGIDTSFAYSIGGDHVNDDLIIVSLRNIFVLHFGWSS